MKAVQSQAIQLLALIRLGTYYPGIAIHKIDFEDGSQLLEDINGIGWYISKDKGGVQRPVVSTPPATRKVPNHRNRK